MDARLQAKFIHYNQRRLAYLLSSIYIRSILSFILYIIDILEDFQIFHIFHIFHILLAKISERRWI